MTTIDITLDDLIVRPVGFDQLWAFKRQVSVPLVHVAGVRPVTDAPWRFLGLRLNAEASSSLSRR